MSRTNHKASNSVAIVPGFLAKTAILALLWYVIAGGQTSAWITGLPAVALTAMASARLGRTSLPRISVAGPAGFVALFLRESVRGGLDVARRTLAPKLRIQPGFTRCRPRLNNPLARALLINCIALLPGTLAARERRSWLSNRATNRLSWSRSFQLTHPVSMRLVHRHPVLFTRSHG